MPFELDNMSFLHSLLRISCFLPWILLIAAYVYVEMHSGWGAFGAGVVFVIPLTVSAVLASVSGILLIKSILGRKAKSGLSVYFIIAFIPVGWFFLREAL